ncbi:MAG: DUF756 domain-containing protein [Burkholderiales bacterium]|nr:DUF756 domain-containing protein [Burkholderiales bacterium]
MCGRHHAQNALDEFPVPAPGGCFCVGYRARGKFVHGRQTQNVQVGAGQIVNLRYPLATSYGWYDLAIQCGNSAQFLRHIAGHVETGKASRTDPLLGSAAGVASLVVTTGAVKRNSTIVLGYSVPAAKVDGQNWIGIYRAGSTPGGVGSLLWQYAPLASGALTFDTTKLEVGDYDAYMLYQNGYVKLAGPCSFKVI